MTETGYGPGAYAQTDAVTPGAPVLADPTSETIDITLADDGNPGHTEYAVYNETDGTYLDADGTASAEAVWLSKSAWGTVTVVSLTPLTTYSFKAKARNVADEETAFGDSASLETYGLASDELTTTFEVRKASSTIAAPSFMSGLATSIRLAGKSLRDFGFHVDRISGLDMPRVVPDEELVPGAHTWLVRDEYFAPKRIVMEGYIHGSSVDDLRLRLACLKSFLATFEGSPWRSRSPVSLERTDLPDRHWLVYYESADTVETLGKRDLSSSARMRVTVKCPTPFARSNETVRVIWTPSAGSFKTIDLGNAPSDAVFTVTGAATDPTVSVGDMVFLCDFAGGLAFTDAENAEREGTFTPSGGEAAACRTTETGMGLLVSGTDTVSYTADGNPVDGAWIIVLAPQWQSSSQAEDVAVFEHRADADNYLRIYWDGSEQAWVFRKRAGGIDAEVSTGSQSFTAGTRIVLGITYDATNAGGMKLFVNGAQEAGGGDTAALESTPDSLTLHDADGAMQPNAVFDLAAGWSRMLSADEMLRIAVDPTAVRNRNVTVAWNGSLVEGDMLTLDSARKTAEVFDVSEGTRTNALGDVTGDIPVLTPGRRRTASDRTQTVIRTKNAAAQIEVRYRRRYL